MELETINKLYLELSQVASATTAREKKLIEFIGEARNRAMNLQFEINNPTSDPVVYDRSLRFLVKDLVDFLNEALP